MTPPTTDHEGLVERLKSASADWENCPAGDDGAHYYAGAYLQQCADEAAQLISQLMEENSRLKGLTNNARAAAKRAGCDLLREEADAALPYFTAEWEPLRDVAERAGARSAAWLAARARDLQARGLVESKWFGRDGYNFKVWRLPTSPGSGE